MSQNIFFWGAKFKAGIMHNLIENNKISFDCTSRDDIDVVIELSKFIDNLKLKGTENN